MTSSKSYERLNESSKLTLQEWLKSAEAKLRDRSSTPRLDAQIIAEHVLKRGKNWLLVHDDVLPSQQLKKMENALHVRLRGVPIAYMTGQKEFYGRPFEVVIKSVLIPRPDTEEIIEQLKKLKPKASDRLLDIGTGSGNIAITAALELPKLLVDACDVSYVALEVARRNAKELKAKVNFYQSDLLATTKNAPYRFITANLPYVDSKWDVSPETQFEPKVALFADDGGLALIKKMITQIELALQPGGYLLLEADPRQHDHIIDFAKNHGLDFVDQKDFTLVLRHG